MKLSNKTTVKVLTKTSSQGIKDTSKTYYGLVIMQDSDAGSISCTEEVYKAVADNTTVTLETEYNQKYETFRAVGVIQNK